MDLGLRELEIKEIFADPEFNCRGAIAPIDVVELMKSIERNGLLEPIVVQPHIHGKYNYRIIVGHRRFKAFQLLKRDKIPAIIKKDLSEKDAMALNLIENLERKDLTIMQEANAIKRFFTLHMTLQDVAKLINKSTGWVNIRYVALRLDPRIQAEIHAGFLTQEQIKDLESLPSNEQRLKAVAEIKDSRIRGEKQRIKVKPPKPVKPNERRTRTVSEIFSMQDTIREVVGNNIGTRSLAWAAGEISTLDLLTDLENLAKEQGLSYRIPPEMTAA